MAILGIDEVGRGPLAGPLVIGAVILPEEKPEWANELRDSKRLSAKKREKLSEVILAEAPATGLGWVSSNELDNIGISNALKLATRRAVEEIQEKHISFSQIIIDGKINFLSGTRLERFVSTVVKADDSIKEVSAASIIAKVARDNYMYQLEEKYPEYGFKSHVGYGTAKHIAAIKEFGLTPEHRKSFEPIKSMIGYDSNADGIISKNNTTKIGEQGETAVCNYLVGCGHEIIARNFRTKYCEIDVVSIKKEKIYFTEVKYRKNDVFGDGLSVITKRKIEKMRFAAELFLKYYKRFNKYDPVLAVASVSGKIFTVDEWFEI